MLVEMVANAYGEELHELLQGVLSRKANAY